MINKDSLAAWAASSEKAHLETYGNIYRLDSFPWIADDEVLDAADVPNDAVLEVRDTYTIPAGQVKRCWQVGGTRGVGRTSERGLYHTLLLITADAGWNSSKVEFSFRALAVRLGMRPGPKAYDWIEKALKRLRGLNVRFQGTVASEERETDRIEAGFNLIQSIGQERYKGEIDCSCWWNDEVFKAMHSAAQARQEQTPTLSTEQLVTELLTTRRPEQSRPVEST